MRIINVQNQLKAMENIKKLHTFEQQESYVINHIKYQLQDICTKDVGLDLPFAYTMDSSTNPIQIHVLTDYYETILVSYHPDTYVLYDYETIRAIPDWERHLVSMGLIGFLGALLSFLRGQDRLANFVPKYVSV